MTSTRKAALGRTQHVELAGMGSTLICQVSVLKADMVNIKAL